MRPVSPALVVWHALHLAWPCSRPVSGLAAALTAATMHLPTPNPPGNPSAPSTQTHAPSTPVDCISQLATHMCCSCVAAFLEHGAAHWCSSLLGGQLPQSAGTHHAADPPRPCQHQNISHSSTAAGAAQKHSSSAAQQQKATQPRRGLHPTTTSQHAITPLCHHPQRRLHHVTTSHQLLLHRRSALWWCEAAPCCTPGVKAAGACRPRAA